MAKAKSKGKWQCNTCGKQEGVLSGECSKCGPTQTTPLDRDAFIIAGSKVDTD